MPVRRPGGRLGRIRSGLLWASASMLLGVTSHVVAGGQLPDVDTLALAYTFLTALGIVFFDSRRHRFDVTVLVLGVTQFALHLALHLLSTSLGTGHIVAEGPVGHQAVAVGMPGGRMDMSAGREASAAHGTTPGMTTAHALATMGSALCVVHGERFLRRLAVLIRPVLQWISPPAQPHTPDGPTLSSLTAVLPARRGVLLARARPLRGPPGVTVA